MITFERCKEIFSDSEKFCEIAKPKSKHDSYRVNMKHLAKDGFHYDFMFRKRPNGYNDVAEVAFGKWTPLDAFVITFDICDEIFLLKLIDSCHNEGNF